MKVWYSTEFIERGPSLPLELISIGMVREDGEELYLINGDASLSTMFRHPFLQINVVPYLPIKAQNGIIEWDHDHPDHGRVWALDSIARAVLEFVTHEHEGSPPESPELWAYYGAFDHVVLTQMFGTFADHPPGLPMFTHDVMQWWSEVGRPAGVLPQQAGDEQHHALNDARWTRNAYWELDGYSAAWRVTADYEVDPRFAGDQTPGMFDRVVTDLTDEQMEEVERAIGVVGAPAAGATTIVDDVKGLTEERYEIGDKVTVAGIEFTKIGEDPFGDTPPS